MDFDCYIDPSDPYIDKLRPAPEPCKHGHGSNCECQLPVYEGLFVAALDFEKLDGKTRHVIVTVQVCYGGGGREFHDPVSGEVVGCCGLHWWTAGRVPTLEAWMAEHV